MDFFAAEQRAKKRTTRLLVLFGFAVAGTIAAGYVATVLALRANSVRDSYRRDPYGEASAAEPEPFFRPGLFLRQQTLNAREGASNVGSTRS